MTDTDYMHIAITEARNGRGLTSPNPPVGAVIVKDDTLLGKGWHSKAGQPHAEREAIADVLKHYTVADLKGATIYVTLEPCSTTGRTPACVDGIIEAGISRVVYGATDPNPDHSGNADKKLADNGIEVISGIEKDACEQLIKPFTKVITTGLPWVIAKTAMSLDGRITRPTGEGQWLTGELAREEVHRIRGEVDAIIVGGKTVRKDDPSLTIRGDAHRPQKLQPWRVVLTEHGKQSLSQDLKILTDEHKERTLIHKDISLTESLKELVKLGCNSVLLECGGGLMRQFLEHDLVDEVAVFLAPIFTGGSQFGFGLGEHLKRSSFLENPIVQTFGNDTMIRGEMHTYKKKAQIKK